MLILDKPRRFDGSTIQIPLYHRGHLSLFPTAKVWLCLLPGTKGGQTLPEIVISPIPCQFWNDLWRISITLQDRIGLVHDVFEALARNSINVIAAESSSMERQRLHSIEAIVDARLYSARNDGTHEERASRRVEALPGLRRTILAHFLHEIAFLPSGRERLRIRRVRNLFEAIHSYNEAQRLGEFTPAVGQTSVQKMNEGAAIILPTEVKEPLLYVLGMTKSPAAGKRDQYLLVSDTTDRFLRVYFFPSGSPLIAPTILHQDEIGAIAAITAALRRAGFNILTSLSRLYSYGSQAQTEFVLQPPPGLSHRGVGQIKTSLEETLASRELVERYKIEIGYPKGYVTPLKSKRLAMRSSPPAASLPDIATGKPALDTEGRLRGLHENFVRRVKQPGVTSEDTYRLHLVQKLLAEETADRQPTVRGTLFISSSFTNDAILKRAVDAAKRHHFKVVLGKEVGKAPTTREGVMTLMRLCTHFLGIWTTDGGMNMGQSWWPSPWLHWELGVAEAMNLPWHLLISSEVHQDAWKRLAGSTPHSIFSTADFDKKLKHALRVL
ncbi:MAG TPA: ACT domain-containing protein [Blastocatellia bacterium]|nr:ACT domain-containing protein [Blastocatellia bacterium]